METVRQQIVAKFTELLGEGQFVYGSFKSKPHTPMGIMHWIIQIITLQTIERIVRLELTYID